MAYNSLNIDNGCDQITVGKKLGFIETNSLLKTAITAIWINMTIISDTLVICQ